MLCGLGAITALLHAQGRYSFLGSWVVTLLLCLSFLPFYPQPYGWNLPGMDSEGAFKHRQMADPPASLISSRTLATTVLLP